MFDAYYRREGCRPLAHSPGEINSAPAASQGQIVISASVGQLGKNLFPDVRTIQDALNRVSDDQGGAAPDLLVDGNCGPKTKKAIQVFQLKHFGWNGADGLVEPNRQTLAKLNEILNGPFANKTSPDGHPLPWTPQSPMPDAECFRMAHRFILAALANLTSASTYLEASDGPGGGLSVFSRSERMRLLNKHYLIDTLGAEKRKKFDFILEHFRRMRQVFERPGGLWGPAAFVPDPLDTPRADAFAGKGGYYRGGEIAPENGLRIDSIYICKRFSTSPRLQQSATIVHELSHFVGHPERITDHAYYWSPAYKSLTARVRVTNADNYADFAMDADIGRVQQDL